VVGEVTIKLTGGNGAQREIKSRWLRDDRGKAKVRAMPIRDWKAALTRFSIQFEDRMINL